MHATNAPTTVTSIDVTMFAVADQDAARDFYVDVLGWEVRADAPFGADGDHRWLEVAPPGSAASLSLNPPMDGSPGGSAVGVGTDDLLAEHARLAARGLDVGPEPRQIPGAPLMFGVADPDGNHVWVVARS